MPKNNEKYSEDETRKRMEAALRGARKVGAAPRNTIAKKAKVRRRKKS
jgi:hypothetical protein